MKKITFLLASVVLVSGFLTACGDESTLSEVENENSNEANGNAVTDEENLEENNEEDETGGENETNNSNEANAEPEFGTRNNPVEHGDTVNVYQESFMGDAEYEMELLESVTGEEASQMVSDANQFNEEASEGKEYILAKFRVQLIAAEEEPFNINSQQFDVISEGGSSYESFISVSGLEPEFRSDLYEGGENEGWVAFTVDTDDEKPLAKYGDVWFNLRGE